MADHTLRRVWRDASLAAATRLLAGPPGSVPDWGDGRPRRALFLRYDKVGDMLMSTAVIQAIAGAHPALTLDVLASPGGAAVLAAEPGLGDVLVRRVRGAGDALRVGRALRAREYAAVIDGMVLTGRVTATTAVLMAATGAPVRVGVGAGRPQTHVYTHPLPPPPDPERAHHVEWLAQLALPFGVDPARVGRPTVVLTPDERARAEAAWAGAGGSFGDAGRPPRLLVNVSAGTPHRRWPDARFAEVLAGVGARHPGVRVAVHGEPGERDAVAALAARVGGAAHTPALRDALALVAAADVVLTPDTAIAHAAAAFRTPSVVMALPWLARFVPYQAPGEVLFSPGPVLAALPAGPVLAALDRVLAGLTTGRTAGAGRPA